MTVNFLKESRLNRMVKLAVRGQNQNPDSLKSALKILNKCGLSQEQHAKIAAILRNVPSDNAIPATTKMKERIRAVLCGTDQMLEIAPNAGVPFVSSLSINQKGYACFSTAQISFHNDLIPTLFFKCQSKGDWESIGALACVNKHYNQCATTYWKQFDLKLFSPELSILDAKTQEITIDDEPCISKLAIMKCFRDLAPHVEKNEGLTLLTMAKGLTLNQLVEIAANEGMTMDFVMDRILQELGDVPVEQTYVILITNNVFKESRNKQYALHIECVAGHGCEMPTVQEYVALCVFTNKYFRKCLYGQNPSTYGRSSTNVRCQPLIVGFCNSESLEVNTDGCLAHESDGVGGQRKF